METESADARSGWQSGVSDPHYDTLARMAVRSPSASYADLIAWGATAGAMDAQCLLDAEGDQDGVLAEVVDPIALAWFTALAAARSDWHVSRQRLAEMCRWVRRAPGGRATPRVFNGLEFDLGVSTVTPEDATTETQAVLIRERLWSASTDALNPFVAGDGGDLGQWLAQLSRPFTDSGRPPLALRSGEGTPFDRLTSEPRPEGAADHLVSVIMPAFNPDASMINAVTSILAQSWTNLELLICDDGTAEASRAPFAACAALDSRVRILRSDVNRGAYHARNMGLSAARGEFVTFQDIDDWSHPTRLETQIRPLLIREGLLATTSRAFRVSSDLVLSSVGRRTTRLNISSLLFRREVVLRRLGGYDTVRKAADAEFMQRLRSAFGPAALLHLDDHLAFIQLTAGSLSRDDFRMLYRHPARESYRSNYTAWHAQIGRGRESAFVRPGSRAPFPAPAHILRAPEAGVQAEVLFCANLTPSAPTSPDITAEVKAIAAAGPRVAVMEYLAPFDLNEPVTSPGVGLAEMFRDDTAVRVLPGESVYTGLAVIRDPASCMLNDAEALRGVRADHIVVVADHDPDSAGGYDPVQVEQIARTVAGRVSWLPATATIALQLDRSGSTGEVLPARLWGVVRPGGRTGRPSPRPLIGMMEPAASVSGGALRTWAKKALPANADTSPWMWGRGRTRQMKALPHLRVIDPARMSLDRFLQHIDYLVLPPTPGRGAHLHPVAVAALSRNCVVFLDPSYREHFGDAAIYRDGVSVAQHINSFRQRPELWAEQCGRGFGFVAESLSSSALQRTVDSIPATGRMKEPSC